MLFFYRRIAAARQVIFHNYPRVYGAYKDTTGLVRAGQLHRVRLYSE